MKAADSFAKFDLFINYILIIYYIDLKAEWIVLQSAQQRKTVITQLPSVLEAWKVLLFTK